VVARATRGQVGDGDDVGGLRAGTPAWGGQHRGQAGDREHDTGSGGTGPGGWRRA
jgi:hypothetical protein